MAAKGASAARLASRLQQDGISLRSLPSPYQQSNSILFRSSIHTRRKIHGSIIPDKGVRQNMLISPQPSFHNYFSANTSIDRGWLSSGLMAAVRTLAETPRKHKQHTQGRPWEQVAEKEDTERDHDTASVKQIKRHNVTEDEAATNYNRSSVQSQVGPTKESESPLQDVLPHRRRKLQRDALRDSDGNPVIPPDASSQLTTSALALPASARLRQRFFTYLSLTKPRLSFLIVLTTTAPYSLYPIPEILSSAALPTTLSTTTLTLLFLTTGTFLSSASANTLNMISEPRYDALMSRTRNRPLVRNLISLRSASVFALLTGVAGLSLLYLGTNPTVASLSALNIFLYAGVYTPLKRVSVINTWVGAMVGAIPPLMGWCAAAGQSATLSHDSWRDLLFSESSIGGWLLASLLFAWQFPHFNALSYTIRDEYKRAGYRMMAWVNPARNARVALRYSLLLFPICYGLYAADVVNGGFLAVSGACNVWITLKAWEFWRKTGAGGSARGLFWAGVWYLPLVMVGGLVCKTGIWEGVFDKHYLNISGQEYLDDEEKEDVELGGHLVGDGIKSATTDSSAKAQQPIKILREVNLAMMGFKRPS